MRLVRFTTRSGFEVRAVISEADSNTRAVLHVHGFGGDFLANPFIDLLHESLPSVGVAFISMSHHLSGYVSEQYVDGEVSYFGAALSPPILAADDVAEFADFMSRNYRELVLMGHSFGTNLIKYVAAVGAPYRLIFLSPAESVWLYDRWSEVRANGGSATTFRRSNGAADDRIILRFDQFGVLAGSYSYSIPIREGFVEKLLSDPVFRAWSDPEIAIENSCIVIAGEYDDVGKGGSTGTVEGLRQRLRGLEDYTHLPSGHSLIGVEAQVSQIVLDWLDDCGND